jgi:hypothetical protein
MKPRGRIRKGFRSPLEPREGSALRHFTVQREVNSPVATLTDRSLAVRAPESCSYSRGVGGLFGASQAWAPTVLSFRL